MKFLPLLELSIEHSYYADGCCPDFLLTAAPETCRLLRNLRGVLKSRADGVSVVVPVDKQSQPFISLPKDATFTFQLALRNPDFSLFTEFTDPVFKMTPPNSFKWRYPVESERESALFGLVDIPASFPQFSENPTAFTVEFTAKQLHWCYYFVTDLNANGREFAIVDADQSSPPVTFAKDNRTALDLQPDPNDPVAALLARQYPDISYWRFVSTAPLPYQQRPRNLQLRLGDSNLIDHLPNPSVRNYSRIAVNGNLQDALYQVVKYLSNSSLSRV
jgi:hypothetical protein